MAHFGDVAKAALLGLIQALTEFLPVSSSGHLVLAKSLLKVSEIGITMEVVTHFATAVAVVIYLRKRIVSIIRAIYLRVRVGGERMAEPEAGDFRLFMLLVLGTLPAGILGFAVRGYVEGLFQDVSTTGAMLVVTGVFVWATGKLARERTTLRLPQALMVGVAQAIAIIPGISRSGLTVGTGLALGVNKREAFEFSLLLSIPAVLGATLLEALGGKLGGEPIPIVAAAVTAFAAGYLAIALLFKVIVRNRFHVFGYYLIPFGIVVILLTRLT